MDQMKILQQHIELLQFQIEQQNKRQMTLKNLINQMTFTIQSLSQVKNQNQRLQQIQQKLINGIKQTKSQFTQQINYYDNQIQKLKQEIHQKINQNQKLRIQFDKQILIHIEEKNQIKNILDKKCNKINNLQKQIHQQQINKLKQNQYQQISVNSKNDLAASQLRTSIMRTSHISNYDHQNNMMASNISTISKAKNIDYRSMTKSQMKVLMGAVLKSKRQIEKADEQISKMEKQKYNKSMFN